MMTPKESAAKLLDDAIYESARHVGIYAGQIRNFIGTMKACGFEFSAISALPDADGWVSVKDRLPDKLQSVVLVNVDGWENCAGDMRRNIYDCGYLNDACSSSPYWSIRGRRGSTIDAYTHWRPLPKPPETQR